MYTVKSLSKDIFHIFYGDKSQTLLSKYGILAADPEESILTDGISVSGESTFTLKAAKRDVTANAEKYGDGFII